MPDVIYAVERMLHDPPEGTHVSQIEVSPYDGCEENLRLSDGRYFTLDHAGNATISNKQSLPLLHNGPYITDETECILKNYLYCHFHNNQFEKITSQLMQDFHAVHYDDPEACANSDAALGALLPRKNVSCVRQLIDESKFAKDSISAHSFF